jgi:hypothetical protein
MDPEFFQRLNALQNLQNQQSNRANLEQLDANEAQLRANANAAQENASELRKLRQQLNEEANKPQCPHCGGASEQGFDRCKNCGQEVIWHGHFVGKPGTMDQLEMAMEQYEIAEQENEKKRRPSVSDERLLWMENIRNNAAAKRAEIQSRPKNTATSKQGGCLVIACIVILSLVIVVSYSPMLLN